MMTRTELLNAPVATLPCSIHFKEVLKRQDIKLLKEIMDMPVTEMVNLKWFTEEILDELTALLFSTRNHETSL